MEALLIGAIVAAVLAVIFLIASGCGMKMNCSDGTGVLFICGLICLMGAVFLSYYAGGKCTLEKSISSVVVSGDIDKEFLARIRMEIVDVREDEEGYYVDLFSNVSDLRKITFQVSRDVATQCRQIREVQDVEGTESKAEVPENQFAETQPVE